MTQRSTSLIDKDMIQKYAALFNTPQRFLLSGASGFIGKRLVPFLIAAGHSVSVLTRDDRRESNNSSVSQIQWNPYEGTVDRTKLEGFDYVIHLAGENIAKRWSDKVKKKILASRTIPTTFLCEQLLLLQQKPKTFIAASGIGFYGYNAWSTCDESSPQGEGFLAEVVRQWEHASSSVLSNSTIRLCHGRFGVVLSAEGGALKKLLPPFQLGVGGPIGDGSRFMSAVAKDDLIYSLYHIAACSELSGPINICFPVAQTNQVFSQTLAKILHRPCLFPVPPVILKVLFGEMATETILASQNSLPRKLLDSGFEFHYPNFDTCLPHALAVRL